jgi:hypothetical protein
MTHNKEVYDFSEYPIDHILHDRKNSAVIGKFKDETAGKPIIEFVGLKPKMYAIRTQEYESKKAKGVNKMVVKNEIHLSDYKDVLELKRILKKSKNTIRSYKHQLYSISQNKIALSGIDTKRYIKDDGISSFSYGHYQIQL